MLTAWLAGVVMGFAGSVPVAGPINMLVFSYGLQGRLRPATLIAVGAKVTPNVDASSNEVPGYPHGTPPSESPWVPA